MKLEIQPTRLEMTVTITLHRTFHRLNSMGFTPNHSLKLLVSLLGSFSLKSALISLLFQYEKPGCVYFDLWLWYVESQDRQTAIQKSGNLSYITAFLFLLHFQHRLHLSNAVMYYKYINVRGGEEILVVSSTLSKLS